MDTSVVVWDLETVPDLKGFAATHGLDDKEMRKFVLRLANFLSTSITRSSASER
jgi:hypothetical protein